MAGELQKIPNVALETAVDRGSTFYTLDTNYGLSLRDAYSISITYTYYSVNRSNYDFITLDRFNGLPVNKNTTVSVPVTMALIKFYDFFIDTQ